MCLFIPQKDTVNRTSCSNKQQLVKFARKYLSFVMVVECQLHHHRAADRITAKRRKQLALEVATMGDMEKSYDTTQYEFTIRTSDGKKVVVTALGMD